MCNKKVIVRIFGGLGNQLFCYAVARRISLKQSADLVIDNITCFEKDPYNRIYQLDHFDISCRKVKKREIFYPFSRFFFAFVRFFSKYSNFEKRKYIKHEGVEFDKRVLGIKCNGTLYLEACWQSELYFSDIEDTLRDELKIQIPNDSFNISMLNSIMNCESVFIHFRFFDDKFDSVNNANYNYYVSAVKYINQRIDNPHYFIFSDNMVKAKGILKILGIKFTLVDKNIGEENAYKDLLLMSKCKHSIIANSTFSWWGAWLNGYKDKIIIAPDFQITDSIERVTMWGFDGLIPDNWVKIKV